MTNDEARAYLRRFDEQELTVRFVDRGTDEKAEEIWTANFANAAWQDDEPAEALLAAIHKEQPPPSHTLSVRRGYVNWGASGATQQFILTVAAGALGTSAAHLLRLVVSGMVGEMRSDISRQPFTREQAEAYARQQVARQFGLLENKYLTLISDEHRVSEDEWTFIFQADGVEYDISISDGFDSAFLSRIKRRLSD